ncbi:hypothetical protein [Algoriphagus aquimarinus]|uniref:hypothetical protein n=1 Tax=Algoriphagus aquimarinus TaxID=237018 RepID=UPI0030D9A898
MQLEEKKFLLDILTAIDSIDQYLDRKRDFQEYLNQKMLRRAVERELVPIARDYWRGDK